MTKLIRRKFGFRIVLVTVLFALAGALHAEGPPLRFAVTIGDGVVPKSQSGRLFVFINKSGEKEPRLDDSDVSFDAPPIIAKDVRDLGSDSPAYH